MVAVQQKWRTALSFKRHASRQSLVYDLHKIPGVYSLPIMLVFSGIVLEVPEYANSLIGYFSALRPAVKPLSVDTGSSRISLDDAVRIGQQVFPDVRLRWIETPDGNSGTYRINLYQPGEPGQRFPKSNVWVDQYSGRILAITNPRSFTAGDTLIGWLHPLHSGEALGLPERLSVLVAGLICPLLFTGL